MLFLSAAAQAQTDWVTVGSGDFSTSANWSSGVPNSATNAFVTNGTSGTPSIVDLGLGATGDTANLTIGSFDTLNVELGATLNVFGSLISNNGAISVTGGGGANGFLGLSNSATLTGAGVLSLSYSGSGAGGAYLVQNAGGVTLTNQSTIQGAGVIGYGGLTVDNASGGTINANVSGQTLTLNASGGVTNAGLLGASGAGTLDINAITVSNIGGNIMAGSGSTVDLTNVTVNGGTLNNSGGTLQTVGTSILNGTVSGGLTLNGTYTGGTGTTTDIEGTIINNGTFAITGGSGANGFLGLLSNTTLQGGTVTMAYNGSGAGTAYILQNAGGLTLTNEGLIQGTGVIGYGGLTVVNASGDTIDANASGQTLTLNAGGGVTNAGLLEATGGGTLDINSITVTNTGSNITAGSGSTVDLTNATVNGGTLNNSGGTLQTEGASILNGTVSGGLTLNGTYIGATGTFTDIEGTIINNGTFAITGGSGANGFLGLLADTTLKGGTVTMAYDGSGAGTAIIQQEAGGLTLTNEGLIQGTGVIGNGGLTVVNASGATIDANVSGLALTLSGGGGLTNAGLLEATGGATLDINSITVNNTGANITAGSGSTVDLTDATVNGGTLNNSGGTLQTEGFSILNGTVSGGLTLNGTLTGATGTFTDIEGTIINNGTFAITGGSGANGFLGLLTDTTLKGGTVTMAYDGSGAGTAIIQQEAGGLTLTNEGLIQGTGVIGNGGLTVVNAPGGTIDANVSGLYLTVNAGGGLTNTGGTLEATNGGILALSSSTIDNAGGTIKVSGPTSAVQFVNNTTIEGGTLTSLGGGSLVVPLGNQITLDGSTEGAITLSTGSTLTAGLATTTDLIGTVNNNGNIQITGGGGANSFLGLNGDTTLQGSGTVSLAYSGSGAGQAIIQQQAGGVTLTNKSTIQGTGTIGNGGLTVVNSLGGTIDANVSGLSLTVNAGGGLTNTGGTLEASNGGTLALSSSTIDNAGGTIEVNGASSTVQFVNDATIQGGTLTSLGGGSLVVPTGNQITLDGSTKGAITLSAGSTFTAGPDTTTDVIGTVNNNGNIQITGGGGSNSFLGLNGDTTLQGSGTVSLAYSGSGAGQAIIQQQAGGVTLTNKSTIQGTGTIGNGGLTVVNSLGGTIDANVSGLSLTVNAGGGLTNTGGTLEASNGGTLALSSSTIDNAGGTIEVNGASSTVQFVNDATIQGGTLTSLGGGSLVVPTGNLITLDGSTKGAITLSAGSTFTAGPDTTTDLIGTVNNNGNIQITGGGGSNGVLGLNGDTTLQGSGTVSLAYSGSGAGQAIIQQQAGGVTLTNESTIQGTGTIGNGGLSVVNASGGTILANAPGQTLIINGTGGFTNDGMVKVSSGSTLQVMPITYAQNGGSTIIHGGGTLDASAVAENGGLVQVDGALNSPSVDVGPLGTLSGIGTITGDVTNDGKVVLGDLVLSPATLSEVGNFTQESDGTLDEGIGSLDHGQLSVTGNIDLGGTVDISLLGGFVPANNEEFELINYSGAKLGAFSGVTGSDASEWTVVYNPGQVDLEFNASIGPPPVPDRGSTLLLLGLGLCCVAIAGHRSKRVLAA